MKRALLILKRFEKDFQEQAKRLHSLQASLQACLLERQTQFLQQTQLQKLLRPSDTHFIPDRLPGTLEWIWAHPAFSRWLDPRSDAQSTNAPLDSEGKTLIIHGAKGSGKSVLASSVAEGLQKQGKDTLFFSFWAGNEKDRRVNAMMHTILSQLLKGLPAVDRIPLIPHLLAREALTSFKELLIQIKKNVVISANIRYSAFWTALTSHLMTGTTRIAMPWGA